MSDSDPPPAPTKPMVPATAESRLDDELANLDRPAPERLDDPQRSVMPTPWVTYVLIAANLIVFGIEIAAGADAIAPTPQKMIELGGNFAPLTLHGEPWRLISSMFLHYGLIHIGFNLVSLWQGRVVEQLFGRAGFISIYLVAGLLGGVASMARNANVVSVGASGAVFGIYGAYGAFLVFRRTAMADAIWRKTTGQIAMFVGINLVYGFATPGIDMSAHIGGIVAGFAIAGLMLVGKTADTQRTKRAIGVALAGIVLAGAAIFAIRPPSDVMPILDEYDRVEAACIGKYNEISARAGAGTITDAQMADEVERDVLAPWKRMHANLSAVDEPPARLQRLFVALRTYVASRQAGWEILVIASRSTDEAEQEKLIADYAQKNLAVTKDFEALKTELAALKQ